MLTMKNGTRKAHHTPIWNVEPRIYKDEECIPLNPQSSSSATSLRTSAEDRHLLKPSAPTRPRNGTGLITIASSLLSVLLCTYALISFWIRNAGMNGNENPSNTTTGVNDDTVIPKMLNASYASQFYDRAQRVYRIEQYDTQPVFTNFLPGIAGYYGIPMYVFYINRGQAIASFGLQSKQYPMQEYHAANVAEQVTPWTGFRTWIQIASADRRVLEPFGPPVLPTVTKQPSPQRNMYIGSNTLQIQELDYVNHLETNVTFFVLPEEDFGALAKRTTITYLPPQSPRRRLWGRSSPPSLTISVLDGLAQMIPAGGQGTMNDLLKDMGRTLESWMRVDSPYDEEDATDGKTQMPFYRLSMQPTDTATVIEQEAGHWCISILEERGEDDPPEWLPILYDPDKVFGVDTTLMRPVRLYSHSISEILQEPQYGQGKTPSAFAALDNITLRVGESVTLTTFFGKADHLLDVPVIARRLLQSGFALFKATRANELAEQITSSVESETAYPIWDGHAQQMFLDNSLRGGIPQILGEDDDSRIRCTDEDDRLKVFHLFSRVHGDLERDYNDFEIAPTFFSNGPGNFRDVIQNRRNDVFFNPRIGSFNVQTFLSFIQTDGYEPLVVDAVLMKIDDIVDCENIAIQAVGEAEGHRAQRLALIAILHAGFFRPGQLFHDLQTQGIELVISRQDFMDLVAAASQTFPSATFTTGYWADHWTYYLDIIETYLSIYPDWEKRILFDAQLPYFSSPASVKPRREKYVLVETSGSSNSPQVRQVNATTADDDKVRPPQQTDPFAINMNWHSYQRNWKRDTEGEIFTSAPMEKLFLLVTVKFATRDPYGVGILYEGGKPGWNDANNGLVGMIGSGTPELYELHVLMKFVKASIQKYQVDITVPLELYHLVGIINTALDRLQQDYEDGTMLYPKVPPPLFSYWDTVATALEEYRTNTDRTLLGTTRILQSGVVDVTLQRWLKDIERGIERGRQLGSHGHGDNGSSGVPPTYFYYEVVDWEPIEDGPYVRALAMEIRLLPLFLEGPTRFLKTVRSKDDALQVYTNVRTSGLRDAELSMYTVSASLAGQPLELGRVVAFPAGWLENQSVWLHMSYKYYLQLLRQGLYDEFFAEMTSGAMLPFMDPDRYGRSVLECSSFLASSAYADPSVHGRGFLPRLSGSTSEFLSMWIYMMIGPRPFSMHAKTGQLQMQLIPTLPLSFFYFGVNGTRTVRYKLFSSIDVVYYNLRDTDLFQATPSRYVITSLDGSVQAVEGPALEAEWADKIRRIAFVVSLEVYFE